MQHQPQGRRRPRSAWVTAALVVMGAATVLVGLVGVALALGHPRWTPIATGVAILAGWVSLRLTWNALLEERFENATDRSELAKTYRELFAERAVEQRSEIEGMTMRLRDRERVIGGLEEDLATISMRAIEAENTARRIGKRLAESEGRVVSLEDRLAQQMSAQLPMSAAGDVSAEAPHPAVSRPPAPAANAPRRKAAVAAVTAVPEAQSAPKHAAAASLMPEWADVEADPNEALLKWEEHANGVLRQEQVRGDRHRQERKHA